MAGNISVTILTRNSAKCLAECLGALVDFDEVVVLDNGSTDETMEIARRFPNVSLHEHPFIGFGPMKNLAVDRASNDWILSIDSDEVVDVSLVQEILGIQLDDSCVYEILRNNLYHGRLVNGCGWGNDRVQRLFNRRKVRFSDRMIHEGLEFGAGMRTFPLKGTLKHYAYDNAGQLIQKLQQYSTLWADERKGLRKISPLQAFISAGFAFFKYYLVKGGWRYGYEGLLISISNANGVFYKYIKLYEANRFNDL